MSRLEKFDQWVSQNDPKAFAKVQAFVKDKRTVNTKQLRDLFDISGIKAAAMLRNCGFQRWSQQRNKTTYRRIKNGNT